MPDRGVSCVNRENVGLKVRPRCGVSRACQKIHLEIFLTSLDNLLYIHYSRYMESERTILALAALAQSTRLDVFRLLVRNEPGGLAAGDIAKALAVPQNTMSSHLAILARAGLISATRTGRSIAYRANLAHLQDIVLFMLKDCCGGRPEICAPVVESLTPCCAPVKKRKANV